MKNGLPTKEMVALVHQIAPSNAGANSGLKGATSDVFVRQATRELKF